MRAAHQDRERCQRILGLDWGFDGIIVKGPDFNRANQEVDIIVVIDVRTIRIIAD